MRGLLKCASRGPLAYTVTHRPRVTRRLHLERDEHGGLVVVAPRHWPMTHIEDTLHRNAARVERFLDRTPSGPVPALRYVQGEGHFYLGRRYPLVILEATAAGAGVVLENGEVRLDPGARSADIRLVLRSWYLQRAREVFSARLQRITQRAGWVGDTPVELKLRRMKRTWGNCSSAGVIKLNTHLVKAPLPLIDGVIAHEVCHLAEMNHSRAFYRLLGELNPGWRRQRDELRLKGNLYLLE